MFAVTVLAIVLYFLPSLLGRHKRRAGAIFVLNLLLGWTVVGWLIAMAWALTAEPLIPVMIGPGFSVAGPYCSQCGSPSAAGGRFCSGCGSPMQAFGR